MSPAADMMSNLYGFYWATYLVAIQRTSDLPDSGVKSAHIHLYTARFFLVFEQIRGTLNSYE
jgi:hypothetical protein